MTNLAQLTEIVREVRQKLATKKGTQGSVDGEVSVTVDGNGKVLKLDITRGAIRRLGPTVLGTTIAMTVNHARLRALRRSDEIVREAIASWEGANERV